MGGKQFTASDEESGFEVARYLVQLPKEKWPKYVIVHSFNTVAATRMTTHLVSVGLKTFYIPFNPKNEKERMKKK